MEDLSKLRMLGRVPEGDTVHQAARRLDAALTGKILEHTAFRTPEHHAFDLNGLKVGSVVSRGKHLLIRVADATVHSLLSSGGRWDVYATGERARSPIRNALCVLRNRDFQAVGIDLDVLRVFPTVREPEAVGHLGPDPLGHSWDPVEAARRLALDPARPIGAALVDQRLIAGLGNVYRAEVLFTAGVNPHASVGDVADLPRIVEIAHGLMNANRDHARRQTASHGHGAPYWVFGRGGLPCPRCNVPVVHEFGGRLPAYLAPRTAALAARSGGVPDLGGHDLFWCQQCQPLPAKRAVWNPEGGRSQGLVPKRR